MVVLLSARPRTKVGHGNPNKNNTGRKNSVLMAAATLMCLGLFMASQFLNPLSRSLSSIDTKTIHLPKKSIASNTVTNAATGQRFAGSRVREFQGSRRTDRSSFSLRFSSNPQSTVDESLQEFATKQSLYQKCEKWAVVTTIYEPSDAIKLVASSPEMNEWCMVVVADTKTPEHYTTDAGWNSTGTSTASTHKVEFLSVSDQLELAKLVPFVAQTPFRSFARKNIGYLYAIWMGATTIFDFDDDNVVKTQKETNNDALWSGTELLQLFTSNGEQDLMVKHVSMSETSEGRAFNPFPMMGASVTDAWPRGLPISLINDKESRGKPGPLMLKEIKRSNVAVIQSTCDNDPDVDAIFRLSRPLPFQFDSVKASAMTVDVPRKHYSPYNAQATLHFDNAFWGLYLPVTVTGRVSDIWRSYIVQRLLRELDQEAHVMYSPPMVTQFRNAHDYTGDFAAEQHLYLRTEALLEYLDQWQPILHPKVEDNLQSRVEDLWIGLYERQFVELQDVEAIQEWLLALEQGAYTFPSVKDHSHAFDVSIGGIAARQQCAQQRLLKWEEPIPTMMNGTNLGALKLQHPNANDQHKSVARLLAEYEADHPFPHSIDLVCRAGGHHSPHELAVMIESVQLYWPKCAGRIVLVLDRGDEEFARENIPSWVEVMYSEFAYGMPGRMGNQLFNMYSDQQGRSEYVAIIDSDTALTTPVTPDLIFNLNQRDEQGRAPPIVLAETTYQKGFWSKGDNWMFEGDSNDWTFMVTLPIVFPRAMFPKYRAGVEAIHNNEFETTDLWQHFRTTMKGGWMAMSQFCLLGNWLVRHWTDGPIDLRIETSVPSIRYGVHLPYHRGIDFRPGGSKDPASFMMGGRRVIQEGLCELFCSGDDEPSAPRLETCSSLCPAPVAQPRVMYFKYESIVYGTTEQQIQVLSDHFKPLRQSLALLTTRE